MTRYAFFSMSSPDVRDVLGVKLADGLPWRPLTDLTVSRLVEATVSGDADQLLEVILSDSSLASWLLSQWPADELCFEDLSHLLRHAPALGIARRLRDSLEARQLSQAEWFQFQRWWIRAANLMRRTAAALHDLGAAERNTAAVLSLCFAGNVDEPFEKTSEIPVCLTGESRGGQAVLRAAIERSLEEVDDSRTGKECQVSQLELQGFALCLTPLHKALPRLFELVEQQAHLEHAFERELEVQKIAAMKELAYGASHEINNPLANISSRAQVLMRDEANPERRRSLATINSQAFRAHEMIADMMLFAKPPALTLQPISVGELFRPLVALLESDLKDTIEMSWSIDSEAEMVSVDAEQMAVAIQAICANASEAMGGQGQFSIRVRRVTDPLPFGGPRLEIELRDNGPGVSDAVRAHLFDPFYSGREAGRGLGFGLSKAWRIVELHGGTIVVHSEAGRGATFVIALPIVDS